ncbi:Deoxyuridine 5'-triphosphate nucleotidohydrolase [Entamoeba marina]
MSEASKVIKVKKLSEDAILPTRGSEKAAGLDLYSTIDFQIEAHSRQIIPMGISIEIPTSCYGRVAPRSSLTFNYGIDVGGGVIDEDYRGEIKVILFNHSNEIFNGKKGDRIAQLIIEKIENCSVVQVHDLSDTQRNQNGFGSSGR